MPIFDKIAGFLTSNSMEVGNFLCGLFVMLFVLFLFLIVEISVDIVWKLGHQAQNRRETDLWERELDLRERELKAGRFDRIHNVGS